MWSRNSHNSASRLQALSNNTFFDRKNQHNRKDCVNTLNKKYININHKLCERTTDMDNRYIFITAKIWIAMKKQYYVKSFQDSWVAHLVKKHDWISKML